jgi:hypothetical protein
LISVFVIHPWLRKVEVQIWCLKLSVKREM